MSKRKDKSHVLQTCFGCNDNKIICGTATCKNKTECIGCKICRTFYGEPCIHCDIDCSYENTCFIREEWKDRTKKELDNETQKKIFVSKINNINCKECQHDYLCMYNDYNICPEDMSERKIEESYLGNVKDVYALAEKNKLNAPNFGQYPKSVGNENNDVWDTKIECISDCPHKTEIKIKISMQVVLKLTYLQQQFPSHEFTVYANTTKKDDEYLLEDIVIPKQKVSYAAVNEIIIDGNYNTIIHKHPGDKPGGFSGVDDEFANSNHDFSVLIGSKGLDKIIGTSRIKTECGKFMRVPLKFEVTLPSVTDEKFLSEVNNIERTVFSSTSIYKNDKIIQEWSRKRRYFY